MINKFFISKRSKVILPFLSAILFVYIVLFEFILPANKILPKPSVLIDSIYPLFLEYNFIVELSITLAVIFLTMLIAYLSINYSLPLLIKISNQFANLKELITLGNYIIPLFLIFIFEQWFDGSLYAEFIFSFILIISNLKIVVIQEAGNTNQAYWNSAKSLGLSDNEVLKKVVLKEIQPKLIHSLISNNASIWGFIFVYEYVCKSHGIGSIFYTAIKYNDLSIIVFLIIISMVLIFLSNLLLTYIKQKFVFWN